MQVERYTFREVLHFKRQTRSTAFVTAITVPQNFGPFIVVCACNDNNQLFGMYAGSIGATGGVVGFTVIVQCLTTSYVNNGGVNGAIGIKAGVDGTLNWSIRLHKL